MPHKNIIMAKATHPNFLSDFKFHKYKPICNIILTIAKIIGSMVTVLYIGFVPILTLPMPAVGFNPNYLVGLLTY